MGPDTALTIRSALAGGRRAGIFTALGVISGQAVWALAASAGVAALLVASEPAFEALKLLGAAYLAFLGVQALRAALAVDHCKGAGDGHGADRGLSPALAFRQGLISDLGNPKMTVFFTSLLPQFTGNGGSELSAGRVELD